MPIPGSPDFAKLAQEATAKLNESPTKQVKVAAQEGGVPAPSNEQVEFNTEEVHEQVQDSSAETQEDVVVQEDDSESSVKEPVQNNEPSVKELSDDTQVKVKIDGEEQVISYKDYKDILRKNATVTQRMQQIAKSREEFNNEIATKLAELKAYERQLQDQASKRDPLYDTLVNALKGQVEPKPRDPNEIVTYSDVIKQREELIKQFQDTRSKDKADFDAALKDAAIKVQEQAQIQKEKQLYMDGLNKIISHDDYKVLNEVIPNFTASVMFHVQQLGPQNLEEALEYSQEYVKERSAALKKLTVASQQAEQAKAAKQKMESNDGASPTITKREQSSKEKAQKFVSKGGKLNWDAMKSDALARMNSMN